MSGRITVAVNGSRFDRWAQAWLAMIKQGETPLDQRLTWKIRTFAVAIITVGLFCFVLGYLAGGGT